MSIIIEDGGLFSSFQDLGRKGYEHLGIIASGALDSLAHEIANRLVGNDKNEATLEMTHKMARIRFTEPTLIAITGAHFKAHVGDMSIYPSKLYRLEKGDVLTFTDHTKSTRAYLAVAGGFELDTWLGSTSTDMISKLGGFHGRTLKAGDEINMKRDYNERHHKLFENLEKSKKATWGVDGYTLSLNYLSDVIHVIKSKGAEDFTEATKKQFTTNEYKLTSKANRVGIVLDGVPIKAYYDDMPPHQAVKRGSIQVKRDGTPIILLNDHYTLGSYPQLGTVASYHISKISQKPQGAKLKFQYIDIEQAEKNLIKYDRWVNQLFHCIEFKMQEEMAKVVKS
ncbi:biotin-dependent carboxyltransferase family protein [Staphylococcus massiliensis]|uniref:Allophanate hydrolase subunit 2 n=1 Tax=Staphylococcus massiliensis S46 TaxID=1229783 RepID=K9AR83_9STAP|nr:biotin-dependent carboxyltransferase family protein [Staphylococcus massiliensis]EKU48551.1 allophanate hydrolase subunit 2 [Staphylococcus massiliensis S46]MCG3400104.1 biotin-dependent carboxyltransferase family protein [Staphylococcus massiliensis]MCG3401826.1 biotin-dependent carboxyltransferase family protein [Staphylococcus massiliensis]MCG3413158.1 biotin-dependent carboxyltransferase family protein [Staphylococcus massiliensis]POA00603.1 allophanate hydrolase [Staphylococcus massili